MLPTLPLSIVMALRVDDNLSNSYDKPIHLRRGRRPLERRRRRGNRIHAGQPERRGSVV